MNDKVPKVYARIYARHGHRCPMSTLGGRLGLAALKWLDDDSEPVRAFYSNRTCALDGIAETTGCREESQTLEVVSDGRHLLKIQGKNASVTCELTARALAMAGRYRSLCNRLERGWADLDSEEQARRRAEMDAMLDDLLPELWHAEDEILVKRVYYAKTKS